MNYAIELDAETHGHTTAIGNRRKEHGTETKGGIAIAEHIHIGVIEIIEGRIIVLNGGN